MHLSFLMKSTYETVQQQREYANLYWHPCLIRSDIFNPTVQITRIYSGASRTFVTLSWISAFNLRTRLSSISWVFFMQTNGSMNHVYHQYPMFPQSHSELKNFGRQYVCISSNVCAVDQ